MGEAKMDTFEAIKKRKSVRAYEATPVPKEALEKILEAARLAPSAARVQPWHFIVVTGAEKRKDLSGGRFAKFLTEAPLVIVACGDTKASPDWCYIDVAIAAENIVLAATSEGLGTCWIGSFDEGQVKKLLKIPENFTVVALLAVGYPRDKTDIMSKIIQVARGRKKLEDIVSAEEYGKPLLLS
jgi:nitroreductase